MDQSDSSTNKLSFKNILASLLPGIFLIGYNIGTGSLTAMSKAGANYGTDLLWAVLLSCLITWYLINFFSRFTMVTGRIKETGVIKETGGVLKKSAICLFALILSPDQFPI